MLQHEDRILFLKEFTKELILNSKSEEEGNQFELPEKQIEFPEEKIELNEQQIYEKIIRQPAPIIIPKEIKIPISQPTVPIRQSAGLGRTIEIGKSEPITKLTFEINEPQQMPPAPIQSRIQNMQIRPQFPKIPQTLQIQPRLPTQEYMPQPTAIPPGFDLGEINFLISDPRVTIIECQGPGKLIIARIFGKSTVTKLILSQDKIQEIIERFSKESKIPIISGLFKAAVGNLLITAVVSDLVGSRFIITKITPTFVIEQQNLQFR